MNASNAVFHQRCADRNFNFIAVGAGGKASTNSASVAIWYSIDDMKFDGSSINSVCYADGKFIAVGNSGKGSYSGDGINWTAIDDMKFDGSNIKSICKGFDNNFKTPICTALIKRR